MATKRTILIIIIFGILLGIGDLMILKYLLHKQAGRYMNIELPIYTTEQIARYDGSDSAKPVLLALDGLVYDVSSGREDFYNPGQSYHYLVGKDSSAALHVFGAKIITDKYRVVGRYQP